MDIPRLVTALADWLACLLYLRFLPPRYGGVSVRRCTVVHWRYWHSTLCPPTALTAGGSMYCTRFLSHLCCFLWRRPPVQTAGRWGISARGRYSGGFCRGADMADVCIFCALHRSIAKSACVGALYCGGVRHHLRPDVASGGWRQHGAAFSLTFGPARPASRRSWRRPSTFCPASAIRS